MKLSYTTALVILVAASCLGWRTHRQIASARERNATLLTEAASLGLAPDPEHPYEKVIATRQRESAPAFTSADYIAFMKDMKKKEKKGGTGPDEEAAKRIVAVIDRLSSLDPDQLKRLIRDVGASNDLDEDSRMGGVMIAFMSLADRHPQAALALLGESEDLLSRFSLRKQVATSAIGGWAKNDPMAAVKWFQENSGKYSDLLDDQAKTALLAGAAAQDPKLAFQLIGELKFKDGDRASSTVLEAAKTPEERTASLKALREYAAGLANSEVRKDVVNDTLRSLADNVAQDGFQNAVAWMDAAKLSPSELQSFAHGISYDSIPPSDAGQWTEWLGKNLPEQDASQRISHLVDDWTQKDYQAAGTWLTKTADGPVKQAAVRGYVQAVAGYEPETAVQWAMTLPPGKDRDSAIKSIYQKWPKNDPAAKAAAEAFADQHGLQH